MVVCQICKVKEAEQKHHVSYYPELVIDVCTDCHKLIHKHGVGSPGSSKHEIVKDAPVGLYIPLTSARLYLPYQCSKCGELVRISQSLINLLILRKPLTEPNMKCPACNQGRNFELILKEAAITTGPHSYYVTSKEREKS